MLLCSGMHRQSWCRASVVVVAAALLAGSVNGCGGNARPITEPNGEIHVVGRVADGEGVGLAFSDVHITVYDRCGPTVGTRAETITGANGAFFARISTMIGMDVCISVRAMPPSGRVDLRPDSVVGLPARFVYQAPYDTVQVEITLREP